MSTDSKTLEIKPEALRLTVAGFRLAQMAGAGVTLDEMTSGDLAALPRLVWVALLPSNPDLSERDVVIALANADNEAEIYQALLAQVSRFGEAAARLGKNPAPAPSRAPGKKTAPSKTG